MINVRKNFPILQRQIHGQPLIYFDNAATTQKPEVVIEAESHYYRHFNANVHRGIHTMAEEATKAFEDARFQIRRFINARSEREIIFTKGATEGINLVAQTWGRDQLEVGEGVILRWVKVSANGQLNYDQYRHYLRSGRVKLVALTHVSNTLGTIYPVKQMIREAHEQGALGLVDAAQSAAHRLLDVIDMEPDFLVFSGHKMYGPTGVGVLYVTESILSKMPVYQGGGEMIRAVTKEDFVTNYLPWRFEAGTPNIAGVIGLGAALNYLERISQETMAEHSQLLTRHALEKLKELPDIRLVGSGQATQRVGIIAFNFDGIHPHDVAAELDKFGIAVRAGHHCTQPLHTKLGLLGSVRISFGLYNTTEEIDKLVPALKHILQLYKEVNLEVMPHQGTVPPYASHLSERPAVKSEPQDKKNIASEF